MTHIVDRAVSSKLVAVARGANRPDERGRGETGDGEAKSPTQKSWSRSTCFGCDQGKSGIAQIPDAVWMLITWPILPFLVPPPQLSQQRLNARCPMMRASSRIDSIYIHLHLSSRSSIRCQEGEGDDGDGHNIGIR